MPQISWNEICDRARQFSREWADAKSEKSEKHIFWYEFFNVFGIPFKSVAVFEESIRSVRGTYGFIDLFWKGVLLVEHKTLGKSLSRAESQAFDYCSDLAREDRHEEIPRYVVICDFARFSLFNLDPDEDEGNERFEDGKPCRHIEFPLADLHKHVREFAFIRGDKPMRTRPEDPANMKATRLLAELHDAMTESGYRGHDLERFLVRCLFCLFAEDTGVFEPYSFTILIMKSREDGGDLGARLDELWDVLNTPEDQRQSTLDEDLATFPYVNGGLFAERLGKCYFNRVMRQRLLDCANFFWARISPAIFGSLFQGILGDRERRQIGAHYTSERDIMKVLDGLFLDELRAELKAALADRSTNRMNRLRSFQTKLRSLRFFDPACGCGNFLILAYRELRRMEQEILVALSTTKAGGVQRNLNVRDYAKVDVDQFFGIEIGEWPVRIAEVGLWLADHQCNVELGEALGQTFRRLPLRAAPTLKIANALRTDWREVLPPTDDVFVLGNPPFGGRQYRSPEQQADMKIAHSDIKSHGVLDYVTSWFVKAAAYISGTRIRVAFVSTNSISQGENVSVLWPHLFKCGVQIDFAHRTFEWISEAKGKAHVHVVIIGFSSSSTASQKKLYDYPDIKSDPIVTIAKQISPYLIDYTPLIIPKATKMLTIGIPDAMYGAMANDNGHLLVGEHDIEEVNKDPVASKYLRPYLGTTEMLYNRPRWCFWLAEASPADLRISSLLHERLAKVKEYRLKSDRPTTKAAAATPHAFLESRLAGRRFLLVPYVSSQNRDYIPMKFYDADTIVRAPSWCIPGADDWLFGILHSRMFVAWVRTISGRLKNDFQLSPGTSYNSFPFPMEAIGSLRDEVVSSAQKVLTIRASYEQEGGASPTLADLYDPLTMPPPLVKAHAALDKAVDRCYGKAFKSDRERVEHLFAMYERLTAPLIAAKSKPRARRTKTEKRK